MSYIRVIPRDLFNEAKLLKCLGALYIEAEKLPAGAVTIDHDGSAFDVVQNPDDGSIFVRNVQVVVHDKPVHVFTGMNAKGAYPMYANADDDVISVFTDDGRFHPDFLSSVANSAQ